MMTVANKPHYLIFDLATGKYLNKAGSPVVTLEDFAGVWAPNELDNALQVKYGSTDRQFLATRVSIIHRTS